MNWVLIRGLARTRTHWREFPKLLQNQLGGELICLDLPGVGQESHLESPINIKDYSEYLHQKFSSLKAARSNGPWALVAISLGGMVALDWVARYPTDFSKLVTLNTSAGNLCAPTDRLSFEAIQTIGKLFFGRNVATRERAILELTTNICHIDELIVNEWVEIDRASPLRRKTFVRQLIAASRFQVPESLPFVPLILVGAKDRLTSPVCSQLLAQHLHCGYQSHPEAGHDLPLDDPQWIVTQIENYLAS